MGLKILLGLLILVAGVYWYAFSIGCSVYAWSNNGVASTGVSCPNHHLTFLYTDVVVYRLVPKCTGKNNGPE